MFNPTYIDFPVIGISPEQANRYCKWLSDRYNETLLISCGYYKTNLNQFSEDCFVTESYLADQYYGSRNEISDAEVKWANALLIPAYRLPTETELREINKKRTFYRNIVEYKFDTTSCLRFWNENYLSVNDNSITLKASSR